MVPAAHTEFRDSVLARRVTFLLRVVAQIFVVVLQKHQHLATESFAVKLMFSSYTALECTPILSALHSLPPLPADR